MTTLDEVKARPPIEVRCGHCNEDLSNARSVEIANENIAWLIAEVERLEDENAEMIRPTWTNWMTWVEHTYPRDIFTDTDDQPGSQIVWLTRYLRERDARIDQLIAEVERLTPEIPICDYCHMEVESDGDFPEMWLHKINRYYDHTFPGSESDSPRASAAVNGSAFVPTKKG